MAIYSHSKIQTFEQCPLKFKYKYIDKLEPEIKNTIEGFLGNKVHDTLEWIYNEVSNGKVFQLDEVINNFIESWSKDFNSKIKIVKEDIPAEFYFNQGIKFLIDYFTTHSPFIDNTIGTEMKVVVDLDKEGKYKVQGYIDRLVHHKESNIFEIHDYKTGNTLKTQEELDKDRQLALYSMGIKKYFPYARDIHLIWHFLAFNKKITSKRTEEQLNELKKEIIVLIDKIESTNEFNPNPGCLCKWCEFGIYCSVVKEGYKEDVCKNVDLNGFLENNNQ